MAAQPEPTPVATIEVDQDEEGPVAGADDLSAYIESLRSSMLQGVDEHGRQYHRYAASNKYVMREDADEQDRLDLQHDAFLRTLSGSSSWHPFPSMLVRYWTSKPVSASSFLCTD